MEQALKTLISSSSSSKKSKGELLKGDGSDRKIYLIKSTEDSKEHTIGVYHDNVKENRDFIYLSKQMKKSGIPVPEVIDVSTCQKAYTQQYLGSNTLADCIQLWRQSKQSNLILKAYQHVLDYLHQIQTVLTPVVSEFLQKRVMDENDIIADLDYFGRDFINRFGFSSGFTSKVKIELYNRLKCYLVDQPKSVFVYRDFQSRNIMWYLDKPWFIDFQSAYLGTQYYDLASLLYASQSGLTERERGRLVSYYHEISGSKLLLEEFEVQLYYWVFARRLRSLGTYGFLSMEKGKKSFFDSIFPTIKEIIGLLTIKKGLIEFEDTLKMFHQIEKKWEVNNKEG